MCSRNIIQSILQKSRSFHSAFIHSELLRKWAAKVVPVLKERKKEKPEEINALWLRDRVTHVKCSRLFHKLGVMTAKSKWPTFFLQWLKAGCGVHLICIISSVENVCHHIAVQNSPTFAFELSYTSFNTKRRNQSVTCIVPSRNTLCLELIFGFRYYMLFLVWKSMTFRWVKSSLIISDRNFEWRKKWKGSSVLGQNLWYYFICHVTKFI